MVDVPPLVSVLPFAGILFCIAFCPLFAPHFWHKNYSKVSTIFFILMGLYDYTLSPSRSFHTLIEYLSFLSIIAALFVCSGGILLRTNAPGTSKINCSFLGLGAILASLIGTTGASMFLIRPLLRVNKDRKFKVHTIIFFIFIVSNAGGLLTPIGDPPLFLGFLQGIPFFWTLKLFPMWALMNAVLLFIYYLVDQKLSPAETLPPASSCHFEIRGKINFFYLGLILIAVLAFKEVKDTFLHFEYAGEFFQISALILILLLSLKTTPRDLRMENEFTFMPIKEVGFLFAAIFTSMMPVLMLLEAKGASLEVTTAAQFFWATGSLSSFLDNAPTYLTFLSIAKTLPIEVGVNAIALTGGFAVSETILEAISLGAVLMGAMTYIGNGPNFMVKSIAEDYDIAMPSFFGYMKWSLLILIPLFLMIHWLFLAS